MPVVHISDFPNEVLLEVFARFSLMSLIASRGVNRAWKNLVPLSNIPPARRALLELYDDVIQTSDFNGTRRKVTSALTPFDREAYVAGLEEQIEGNLPAEFRLWVLEWPAKAAFGWVWPGLSNQFFPAAPGKEHGKNCLSSVSCVSPKVWAKHFYFGMSDKLGGETNGKGDRHLKTVALEIWEHGCGWSTWLFLDSKQPELYGTLYQQGEFPDDSSFEASSWVEWLRQRSEFWTRGQTIPE